MKRRANKKGWEEANVMRVMRESRVRTEEKKQEQQQEAEMKEKEAFISAGQKHLDELIAASDSISDVVLLLCEKLKLNGITYALEEKMWKRESKRMNEHLYKMMEDISV